MSSVKEYAVQKISKNLEQAMEKRVALRDIALEGGFKTDMIIKDVNGGAYYDLNTFLDVEGSAHDTVSSSYSSKKKVLLKLVTDIQNGYEASGHNFGAYKTSEYYNDVINALEVLLLNFKIAHLQVSLNNAKGIAA